MASRVQIQVAEFDVASIYQEVREESAGQAGAIVTFVGLVRDRNEIDVKPITHLGNPCERYESSLNPMQNQ